MKISILFSPGRVISRRPFVTTGCHRHLDQQYSCGTDRRVFTDNQLPHLFLNSFDLIIISSIFKSLEGHSALKMELANKRRM